MANIVNVVLDIPIYHSFDYSLPKGMQKLQSGVRVEVPFGKRKSIGLVISKKNGASLNNNDKFSLKEIISVIDKEPILDKSIMNLCEWSADYYQYPLGQVIFTAIPPILRKGRLIQSIKEKKNDCIISNIKKPIKLNDEQNAIFSQIIKNLNKFKSYVIEGITGSGKTELYIKISEYILSQNSQILIIVPEINLTPQTVQRFQKYLNYNIETYHSSLTESKKLGIWSRCKKGEIDIVIGTRSSSFLPFKNLSLIIVDEEHDSSLKQQEKFRYHARDIAIVRAMKSNIPVILGSATPSFETLQNCHNNKFIKYELTKRYHKTALPKIMIIDTNIDEPIDGISSELEKNIKSELKDKKQILLYIGRRGFSHALMCKNCDWISKCHKCDSYMTYHDVSKTLWCHYCGYRKKFSQKKLCDCQENCNIVPVGYGTERIERRLNDLFPDARIMRVDSDTITNNKKLIEFVDKTNTGKIDILVGTQMLVKGHDFPNVSLVGIIDIDSGLFSLDFRGLEKTAQLITQVSGRSGRHNVQGKVIIQTRKPNHHLILELLKNGYKNFSAKALVERKEASLPPFSYIALLRSSSYKKNDCQNFLENIKNYFQNDSNVNFFGPAPAPIAKKNNKYSYQMMISSLNRKFLLLKSYQIREYILKRKLNNIKWSIDIDPIDLY
ncbi:MAG: primosomal protein N' [Gammaproteobacteria bacterium]|nr:primosomal protein N' [Gammaproteobacteria bacterium]|tara:strand:- start:66061 stop:68061 length:2001 start_codon:yes stop_codon:yes gene_type:complete